MRPPGEDAFQFERPLDVGEAKRVLPRLEKDGVRFQIETDVSTHLRKSTGPFRDSRVKLYVHVDDTARWRKIRDECGLSPVAEQDAL
jgi:hypothetical protein